MGASGDRPNVESAQARLDPSVRIVALVVGLAVIGLSWPTWSGLVRVWLHQFGYSHGLLVAPISVWLAWRALGQGPSDRPVPAAAILGAVALTSFLWFLCRQASIRTLEELMALALLWTTLAAVLGWRWGRQLLFPVGYLLFAIPIWEALVPLLQPLTSLAASTICQFLGIPTYLDGNVVHIPNGVFAIAEGCAGNHYFISAITLAALYGYLEYTRWRSSLILVGLAALLAMVCNWLRVVLVIRAGYVTGMHHPWVKDHNMVGWVLFALAMFPLFAVARRLERSTEAERAGAERGATDHVATRHVRVAVVALFALVLIATPPTLGRIALGLAPTSVAPVVAAPTGLPGWRGPMAPDVDWTPVFVAPDVVLRVAYEESDTRVTLFRAGYADQSDGREVISYDNRIEGHEGWRLIRDTTVDAPTGEWRSAVLAGSDGRQRVIVYRYVVGGHPTASRLAAKLWQGWGGIAGNRSASILAVSATCGVSCEETESRLHDFLAELPT